MKDPGKFLVAQKEHSSLSNESLLHQQLENKVSHNSLHQKPNKHEEAITDFIHIHTQTDGELHSLKL